MKQFSQLAWLVALTSTLPLVAYGATLDSGFVEFTHPNGTYTTNMAKSDFGNSSTINPEGSIDNNALKVTYPAGEKLRGLGSSVAISPKETYTIQYRIKYPSNFEVGLHGKQLGLKGGAGYTGGAGVACRTNGDGWSARIMFNADEQGIRNSLYIYHCEMPDGSYGDELGGHGYYLQRDTWHTVKMQVTVNSSTSAKDGVIKVWCDGDLKIDVDDVKFVFKEEGRKVEAILLSLFCGGAGSTPTHDNSVLIDDFRWWDGTEDDVVGVSRSRTIAQSKGIIRVRPQISRSAPGFLANGRSIPATIQGRALKSIMRETSK